MLRGRTWAGARAAEGSQLVDLIRGLIGEELASAHEDQSGPKPNPRLAGQTDLLARMERLEAEIGAAASNGGTES
jgi:hypothetical protein